MNSKHYQEENNKTPSIRFKGFTDPWEQRKLGDMGSTFTGLSGKTKEDFGHGDAQFITYMNVFSNPVANLEMTEAVEIDAKQNRVKKGDVFFTTSSETPEEVGMSCVMPENKDNIYLNSFCFGYRPTEKFDLDYLAYVLRADSFRKDMTFLAQGISRYNISKNKVMEVSIPIPNLEEQTMVGRYFSNLDHLITLHQRKYNKLLNVKKSMLEKMFPKNGSNIPEIRFKGFTDPWEQRKLGDISESYSGGTPTADKKEYYNGDIPFIRSGEISGDKTELFITDEGLNNSSAKMVQIGYILYALYGATSGEVSISKLKGAINQAVLAIQPHQNYDSQFLMQWLRKSKDNIIGTYLQGGQGNLSGNIVKELIVDVPTYEEQKGIGEYFSNLDNLITLHQRELEKLQNIKKSMLEKMFVQEVKRK